MTMSREKERELLGDCIRHNDCEKLVLQYWKLVCSVVRKVFLMKHAPLLKENLEEVYQDVFFHLLDDDRRRLRLYVEKEGHSLTRWIVVIANRTALNYLRKKGFDGIWGQTKKAELDERYGSSKDVETDVLSKVAIEAALKEIPQLDQIVFKLHRFGLSSKDIAMIIDSSEPSVNNRVSKIRKKLKDYIGCEAR